MNHFKVLLYFFNAVSYFLKSYALDTESIIGGDYAKNYQFKYQIYLKSCNNKFCVGAIIADNFVLTAAHCVLDRLGKIKTSPLKVIAGITDINTKKDAVEVNVETIFVHNQMNLWQQTNDIAVLKLKENLGLGRNSHLEKINLPKSDDTYVGKIATVSGYGYTNISTITISWLGITLEKGGYTQELLKFAKVKIINNEECKKKVTFADPPRVTNICGYIVQRGSQPEGICSGDSGGPLVYNKTIIGIVSNSPVGCREDKEPAVYTRVSSYVSFISNILKDHPTNAKQHTIDANSSCDNRKRIRH